MKKQLILSLALMVTLFSFAQKKELKKLEKSLKNNNFAEAKAMLTQLESMTGSMDEKMKSNYYFGKAKAFYANGAGTMADYEVALDNMAKVNAKHVSGFAETKQFVRNELLVKANNFYTNKKLVEASELFVMLYKLVPEDQTYLYYAAVSSVTAQDYDNALKHYIALKDLGYTGVETEFFATNVETGEVETMDKSTRDIYVKAKSHIKPGQRESKSKAPEITKNIALIYVNQGKDKEALAAIKEAREVDPSNSELILTEANVQYKLGNTKEYATLIKQATAADPNNADLLYNLGVLSAQAGNNAEAKEYYKKTIKIDPENVNALTNLAALILQEETKIVEEMNGLGSSASDDKRYDALKLSREDLYRSAIPYLEKVIALDKGMKNVEVARTLSNIYGAVNENVKSKAVKSKYGL